MHLAFAALAGLGLGFANFGALWMTVRRLPAMRRPILLFGGSFVARTVLVCGGLFLVSGGDFLMLASALVGFLAARIIAIQWWAPRPDGAASSSIGRGAVEGEP